MYLDWRRQGEVDALHDRLRLLESGRRIDVAKVSVNGDDPIPGSHDPPADVTAEPEEAM